MARSEAHRARGRCGGVRGRPAQRGRERLLGPGGHLAPGHRRGLSATTGPCRHRDPGARGVGRRGHQDGRDRTAAAGPTPGDQFWVGSGRVAAGVDRSRHPDRLRPGADRRRHPGPGRYDPPVGRCGSPGVGLACLPLGSLVPPLGAPRRWCPSGRATPPQPGRSRRFQPRGRADRCQRPVQMFG